MIIPVRERVPAHVAVDLPASVVADRLLVIMDGDLQRTLKITTPPPGRVLAERVPIDVPGDATVVFVVMGQEPIPRISEAISLSALPFAMTSPFWIDHDADEAWTPLVEQAREALEEVSDVEAAGRSWRDVASARRAGLAVAAATYGAAPATALALVRSALADGERRVRLAGARAAVLPADPGLVNDIDFAFGLVSEQNPTLAAALRAARLACAGPRRPAGVP